MSKVKVLFFAADPESIDGRRPRLLLDEEVRQIRRRIQSARYRDDLDLDAHWATRTKDLMYALNRTHPQVVHFSGHGGSEGLVLAGLDGDSGHAVNAGALTRLFEVFRGDIHVVVLNACFSLPQAEAIAKVVGCAIGTPHQIGDDAAITFSATFYQAIAFGHSMQVAFDQARTALELDHFHERECPQLVVRPGVDATKLFLISEDDAETTRRDAVVAPPHSSSPQPANLGQPISASSLRPEPRVRRVRAAVAALAGVGTLVAGVILWPSLPPPEQLVECAPRGTARALTATSSAPAAASTAPGDDASVAAVLADAKALCQVGNYAAAFAGFKLAAEAGNAEAMGYLGTAYLRGEGIARQPVEGIKWLREAAERRDPRGMNALGVAYLEGDGVDRSERWARYWFKIAADEHRYGEAMRNLGGLSRADGNDTLAVNWYEKAADAGSADAMVDLGLMYEEGRGGGDMDDARHLYRKAAKMGSARGMFTLGRLYQDGVAVRKDYERARSWYLKAANAGSADAMNNLGLLYQNGWGVPQNKSEAMNWFRRGANAGSTIAASNLNALEGS